eukprot:738309-Prorocentrum_minimum.AAC.5
MNNLKINTIILYGLAPARSGPPWARTRRGARRKRAAPSGTPVTFEWVTFGHIGAHSRRRPLPAFFRAEAEAGAAAQRRESGSAGVTTRRVSLAGRTISAGWLMLRVDAMGNAVC